MCRTKESGLRRRSRWRREGNGLGGKDLSRGYNESDAPHERGIAPGPQAQGPDRNPETQAEWEEKEVVVEERERSKGKGEMGEWEGSKARAKVLMCCSQSRRVLAPAGLFSEWRLLVCDYFFVDS